MNKLEILKTILEDERISIIDIYKENEIFLAIKFLNYLLKEKIKVCNFSDCKDSLDILNYLENYNYIIINNYKTFLENTTLSEIDVLFRLEKLTTNKRHIIILLNSDGDFSLVSTNVLEFSKKSDYCEIKCEVWNTIDDFSFKVKLDMRKIECIDM